MIPLQSEAKQSSGFATFHGDGVLWFVLLLCFKVPPPSAN